MAEDVLDVAIVGGGPAGLTTALVLGRCRRRVAVIDAGKPRNRASRHAHGFFTRDGEPPHELLRIGREQLVPYGARVIDDEVTALRHDPRGFVLTTRNAGEIVAKKVVLATGVNDRIPDVPGLADLFGRGVFVCPYCDGWEQRDKRLAAFAPASTGPDFALGLLTWSSDVLLFTGGERLDDTDRAKLERNRIEVVETPLARVEGAKGGLTVHLADGRAVASGAMFVHFGSEQTAPFAEELGCPMEPNGTVCSSTGERSGVPGVWVVGDASHDMQLIAIAVAEGMKAACAINRELREETHA